MRNSGRGARRHTAPLFLPALNSVTVPESRGTTPRAGAASACQQPLPLLAQSSRPYSSSRPIDPCSLAQVDK